MTRLLANAPIVGRARLLGRVRRFTSTAHRYKKSRVPQLHDVKVVDFEPRRDPAIQERGSDDAAKEAPKAGPAVEEPLEAARQMVRTNSLIKAFLYGSPHDTQDHERSFSRHLTSGERTHEITFHWVKPSHTAEYVQLMQEFHQTTANAQPAGSPASADAGTGEAGTNARSGRLLGAWKAVVGRDVDTYVHIWEYPDMASLHTSSLANHSSAELEQFDARLSQTLRKRSCEIVQEFAFWGGTARPRDLGGIFELRKYDLQPGKMLEWEFYWRKGIEYRREVMEPVGAWFTNIGPLNRVYHLWQFTDLHHRKISRQRSWEKPGWAETTRETVKLLNNMESIILLPLDYSPLK